MSALTLYRDENSAEVKSFRESTPMKGQKFQCVEGLK